MSVVAISRGRKERNFYSRDKHTENIYSFEGVKMNMRKTNDVVILDQNFKLGTFGSNSGRHDGSQALSGDLFAAVCGVLRLCIYARLELGPPVAPSEASTRFIESAL